MAPLWRQRQKETADRSVTSRNKSGIAQQPNDFGQDNFDAPSQLGFQRHALAKFTATNRRADSRHYGIEETNRPRRRTYTPVTSCLSRQHARAPSELWRSAPGPTWAHGQATRCL